MKSRNFFAELKRRNVYRVAVAYAVLAWLLVQAASIVLPTFEAPAWILRVIIALLSLGFPCAVIFAWACEVTPEGMKRTADIAPREPMPATKANDESSVPQEQLGKPAIAVLPFDNISGDPEQEYFSDGITEDIITDLSKISGLSVIARHTSFTYKGKGVQVQTVGKELGADFILEGSVRKAGPRVRVTGQLIKTRDGTHIWAERFDRDLTDIFAIQDEITHTIVAELKVKLLPQEKKSISQAPTDNVEAYTYYLRGRDFFYRHSKRYFELARRMFAKAAELDPNYARAYAGMADCDAWLYVSYQVDLSVDGILELAAKALALDNNLAEAHSSRGAALTAAQKFAEANEEFERALALDPASFEAHTLYARSCMIQGRLDRAAQLLERAAEIRPDNYQPPCMIIQVYRSLGQPEKGRGPPRKASRWRSGSSCFTRKTPACGFRCHRLNRAPRIRPRA